VQGRKGGHGLFRTGKNRDAFILDPAQILVPSGFHACEPQGDGLARVRGPVKDSHKFLGEQKDFRVNLNSQREVIIEIRQEPSGPRLVEA